MLRRVAPLVAATVVAAALMACSESGADSGPGERSVAGARSADAAAEPSPSTPPTPAGPSSSPSAPGRPVGPETSDGRPARGSLSIPKLGIDGLVVVPYRGRTDDGPGTAIQNRGLAASPHGPDGGVGPGGVGNYQVTAHRLSSTRAFEFLPRLGRGDEVAVVAGGRRYVYRITTTRETSFRSPRSLRAQRAAVPGRPGEQPTRAMITLSTCATPEDHAAGNYWADEFDNPEHRIDKIGVLVRSRLL